MPGDGRRRGRARRALRALAWTLVVAVVLVTGAAYWLLSSDLGFLKPRVEALLSEQLGRAVTMERFAVELGGETQIEVDGLTIANPAWAADPELLDIGSLVVILDAPSFLGDTPVIESLALADVEVWLEEGDRRQQSWSLQPPRPAQEEATARRAQPRLQRIDLRRARVEYMSPLRDEPLLIAIDSATQDRGPDDFLDLRVDADVGQDGNLRAEGRAGPWGAILDLADIQFELTASMGRIEAQARGTLDDALAPRRPRLEFAVAGPELAELAAILGFDLSAFAGSIDFSGQLTDGADDNIHLDVGGNIGEASIRLEGAASDLQNLEQATLAIDAGGPSLSQVVRFFGVGLSEDGPFDVSLALERSGRRLTVPDADLRFGDATISASASLPQLPSLDDGRVRVRASGPRIEIIRDLLDLPAALAGAFDLELELRNPPNGPERITARAITNLGRLGIETSLAPGPSHHGTQGSFSIEIDDLEGAGDAFRVTRLPPGPASASGPFHYGPDGISFRQPVALTAGSVSAETTGTLAFGDDGIVLDLDIAASGPDFNVLGRSFRIPPWLPSLAFVWNGGLRFANGQLQFFARDSRHGRSTVNAEGSLRPRPGGVDLDLDISAEGPAVEELFAGQEGISSNPGEYALDGRLEVREGMINLREVLIQRPAGVLRSNISVALPTSRREIAFDLEGQGENILTLVESIGPLKPAAQPFRLAIAGSRDGRDFNFDTLDVDLGSSTLRARGRLDLDGELSATRFSAEASVPDVSTLLGGRYRPQPMTFRGEVLGTRDTLQLEDFALTLGDGDLSGYFAYRVDTVPRVDARLSASTLVLESPFAASAGDDAPPAADGRLLPDTRFDYGLLDAFDGAIRLEADAVRVREARLNNVFLDASLEAGVLDISRLALTGRAGDVLLRAHSRPEGERRIHSVDLSMRDLGIPIGRWNSDLNTLLDLEVALDASGGTLREVVNDLTGVFYVNAWGGSMPDWQLARILYGNLFEELFVRINPFYGSREAAKLECFIVAAELDDGIVTSAPNSLLSTSQVRISSSSRVDLETEALDLSIRTTPQRALGVSAGEFISPFTKVTGTLGNPKLSVDGSNALVTGGAAVATAGLSLIAKAAWDRLARSKHPCGDLERLAREQLEDRFPRWVDERP